MTQPVWWSDTVTAAAVSGVLLLFGTFLTVRIKMSEKKHDLVATALEAQLAGWDGLSKNLRGRITELEADNERCNKRVSEISLRLADSETKCDALQDSVIELRRQVEQLSYEAKMRAEQRRRQEKEKPP